jgi:Rab-GTPase-TBC domain
MLIHPKYLLYFIFSDTLPLVHMLSYFTNKLLERLDPQLYNHMVQMEVPDSFWVTKMIMTLFLGVCSIENCLRLWDYFIGRGIFGIVELSASLMY